MQNNEHDLVDDTFTLEHHVCMYLNLDCSHTSRSIVSWETLVHKCIFDDNMIGDQASYGFCLLFALHSVRTIPAK